MIFVVTGCYGLGSMCGLRRAQLLGLGDSARLFLNYLRLKRLGNVWSIGHTKFERSPGCSPVPSGPNVLEGRVRDDFGEREISMLARCRGTVKELNHVETS